MQFVKTKIALLIALMVSIVLLTGCSLSPAQQYQYSDEVDYLYPKGVVASPANGVTVAALPLRIGIAFVPDKNPRGPSSALLEQQKMKLMDKIKLQLLRDSIIGKVELIPSSYLSTRGSFSGLDQIRGVFGVDAIFLFSFEQAQYTDRGLLSLGYWTVIGAYFIPGEKNDTSSMISGVAYDITQRQMLFRTNGISQSKALSTPVNHSQEIREERIHGFEQAAADLLKNLDRSIAEFKQKLRETSPAVVLFKAPDNVDSDFWMED